MTPQQRHNVHTQRHLASKNISGLITDGSVGEQKPETFMVPYNPAANNSSVSTDGRSTANTNPADQFGQRKGP